MFKDIKYLILLKRIKLKVIELRVRVFNFYKMDLEKIIFV